MTLLLNILWIITGGILIWLEYVIVGILLCVTVIGIPFGLQCFKIAGLALTPFGKDIEALKSGSGVFETAGNIIWVIFAGIWIFLSHLSLALGLAVTIIGIPFAIQHVKLAVLSLAPFGRVAR